MDKCLVETITLLREAGLVKDISPDEPFTVKPAVKDMGTEWDELWATLKEKKRNGPNKQERGWMARARIDDMKTMFERRRERRATILEEEGDWAGNALNELADTRTRIDAYGIGEHFFNEGIEALAGVKGVEAPVYSEY